MVTDALINFFVGFMSWMLDSLPDYVAPDWLLGVLDFTDTVFGFANDMSVWFPTPLVLSIVSALFALYLVSFAIKLVRIVISHFTGGGGGAA